MSVKVIADGAVLEALKSKLRAEGYRGGEPLADDDRLVVYAHALVGSVTRRSEHGGLQELEAVLAHPQTPKTLKVDVLGFLPVGQYGKYEYLIKDSTVGYSRLPDISLQDRDADLKKRCDLSLRASESRLEITFSTERHKLKGLAAAIRIYLGALALGHADMNGARQLLQKAQQAAEIEAKESNELVAHIEVDRLLRMLDEHHKLLRSWASEYRPTRYTVKPSADIWLVDDQCKTYLWEDVLKAIYGNDKVRAFETWDAMREDMDQDQCKPAPDATVVVDCNLGEKDQTYSGLERLSELRGRFLELHVVMLSAFDDAQLALTALREGADAYFVKELADRDDRCSIAYYEAFDRAVTCPTQSKQLRELWRKYKHYHYNAAFTEDAPPTLHAQIRLAFYLGFSQCYPENATGPAGHLYGASPHVLPRAMVDVLTAGWVDDRGPAYCGDRKVVSICKNAHHGRDVKLGDAMTVVEHVLRYINTDEQRPVWGCADIPSHSPYFIEDLRALGKSPGGSGATRSRSHFDRSKQASVELVRGLYCCGCNHGATSLREVLEAHSGHPESNGEPYSDVVAIDDEGDSTDWFEALRVAYPGIRTMGKVDLDELDARGLQRSLNDAKAVLLDLRMPTADEGLCTIEKLHNARPGMPVIVVSAATDWLGAMRALRSGAMDYAPKSLARPRDRGGEWAECAIFMHRLRAQMCLARRLVKANIEKRVQEVSSLRNDRDVYCRLEKSEAWQKVEQHPDTCGKGNLGPSEAPPSPQRWATIIGDETALLVALWHLALLREPAGDGKYALSESLVPSWEKRELGSHHKAQRVVVLPLDHWRAEQLITADFELLPQLSAVLADGLVETLARWLWCLDNGTQMAARRWGLSPKDEGSISISGEMDRLDGAAFVWKARNAVLHEDALPDGLSWDRGGIRKLLDGTLKALACFRERVCRHVTDDQDAADQAASPDPSQPHLSPPSGPSCV